MRLGRWRGLGVALVVILLLVSCQRELPGAREVADGWAGDWPAVELTRLVIGTPDKYVTATPRPTRTTRPTAAATPQPRVGIVCDPVPDEMCVRVCVPAWDDGWCVKVCVDPRVAIYYE